jgi:hypothetical protein
MGFHPPIERVVYERNRVAADIEQAQRELRDIQERAGRQEFLGDYAARRSVPSCGPAVSLGFSVHVAGVAATGATTCEPTDLGSRFLACVPSWGQATVAYSNDELGSQEMFKAASKVTHREACRSPVCTFSSRGCLPTRPGPLITQEQTSIPNCATSEMGHRGRRDGTLVMSA